MCVFADGNKLAVGCDDCGVYVYCVDEDYVFRKHQSALLQVSSQHNKYAI